jgi:2-octaprenyl-6-methoxyphenol hydroxylase
MVSAVRAVATALHKGYQRSGTGPTMQETTGAKAISVEAAVVGGGPAGLTAAVALASAGIETALLAPPHPPDSRTTALLGGSVAALETLGVWAGCSDQSAPFTAIRLIDDRGGLLRAPETTFQAAEIGLDAFGHNIENRNLIAALANRAQTLPTLRIIASPVEGLDLHDDELTLRAADGSAVRAKLAVGADGRNSRCRRDAGIGIESWAYPQVALTCNLEHTRPHDSISTEFHTAAGPCTLVPLAGLRSSLVWVVAPAEAERLRSLDDADFARAVERQVHSLLGKMAVRSERSAFPLSGQTAMQLGSNRVALVGEAAHVLPPIGAQGFNLGLRDAATIAELAVAARHEGRDIGGSEVLQRYDARRRPDVRSRTLAVDMLNRSLLSDFLPLQGLRGFGLALLDRIGPLRRALMREGTTPRLNEPQLMRGEPL